MNNAWMLIWGGKNHKLGAHMLEIAYINQKNYVPHIKLLCFEHKSAWMT